MCLTFFAPSVFAAKKTVCTITINSKDEREVFKKRLPPGEWEFVELLPNEKKTKKEDDDDNDSIPPWLEKACERKQECDILAVSGHFGGNFFGDSGYELSLEQLERAACRPGCEGIIKKPKEVFLFGCNTLAGKDQDHRTPEEYLRVLLADGMERSRAEQTVALRYSPWGDANHRRMSNVFSESAKIYGFSSIGPLGRSAGPRLQNYFSAAPKNYSSYLDGLTKQSPENQIIKTAFTDTSLSQTVGKQSRSSSAICYLEDKRVVHLAKVRFVESTLLGDSPLEHAPAIASWLKTVQKNDWTDFEAEMWDRITWNTKLRDNFLDLAGNIKHLPSMELALWRFSYHLRWIKQAEYVQKQRQTVAPYFADGKITREERDSLCSLLDEDEKIAVDYRGLGAKKVDMNMATALACLGNANDELVRIAENELTARKKEDRQTAVYVLYYFSTKAGFKNFNFTKVRDAIKAEKDSDVRAILAYVLAMVNQPSRDEWLAYGRKLISSKNVDSEALYAFGVAGEKNLPLPEALFPMFTTRLIQAKKADEFQAALVQVMGVWLLMVKSDSISVNTIVDSLLAVEDKPMFANITAYLGAYEDLPKAKKIEIFKTYAERTQNAAYKSSVEEYVTKLINPPAS